MDTDILVVETTEGNVAKKNSECGEMMEINESTKIKESTKSTQVEALKSGK